VIARVLDLDAEPPQVRYHNLHVSFVASTAREPQDALEGFGTRQASVVRAVRIADFDLECVLAVQDGQAFGVYLLACSQQLRAQWQRVLDNIFRAKDEFVNHDADLGGKGEETDARNVGGGHCLVNQVPYVCQVIVVFELWKGRKIL